MACVPIRALISVTGVSMGVEDRPGTKWCLECGSCEVARYSHSQRKETSIHSFVRLSAVAAFVLLGVAAKAESLRCEDKSAIEGDSKISVFYKCGQPLLQDSFCAPVYISQRLQPVPEPFASTFVPCQQTEVWLYDRGPGNLMATVRFRSGIVQSITYGRVPH